MTTISCKKCSMLMARCDFKYCPDCGAQLDSLSPSDATACSALDDALALIALGPQRSANSFEWYQVSLEMCKHCKGTENVNEAAARIVVERMKTYDRKLRLLTKEQHRMRDPERTLLCDIIANGQLLPDPSGSRYGQNDQVEARRK